MVKKDSRIYRVIAEPIVGQSVDDVAEKILVLANELSGASDALHRRQLTNSIMHLAADIAVTVTGN